MASSVKRAETSAMRPGALGDDDEVDHHQDDEHHGADDVVAADDEMPEGVDDVPRVAGEENLPGRTDVEREAEEGQGQQQRGEAGEFRGILDVDDGEQDQKREPEVEREERVEQEGRDRQDQEKDGPEQAEGEQQVGAQQQAGDEGARAGGHGQAAFSSRRPRSRWK